MTRPIRPIIRPPRGLVARLRSFVRDETGAILMFTLIMFVGMLVVAGMAVDVMRFEAERSRLQATADRAVLAAAAIEQPLQPEDVVIDYFQKAQLGTTPTVVVDEGLNYRTVGAQATLELGTWFLKMVGIDKLSAPAVSVADERVNKVEISMVLDVSGSMNSYYRLPRLKQAAKEFVDIVLPPANRDKVSVSIVPFASQVAAGPDILQFLNVSSEHSRSHCVDFENTDFSTTTIDPAQPLRRAAHFDPRYWSLSPRWRECPTERSREILAYQQDPGTLKQRIDQLNAGGWTSINFGMKWGVALLDPAFQPVASGLAAQGKVDSPFADRPSAWNDADSLKVAVVMTDGAHTTHYAIEDPYRSGSSNVWAELDSSGQLKSFSVWVPSRNRYWVPSGFWSTYGSYSTQPKGGSKAVRLTYPQLWNLASVNYVAGYLLAPAYGGRTSDWKASLTRRWQKPEKDTTLLRLCEAAKAKGVVIFTIALEMSSSDASIMRQCASSDAHFYDVNGLQLADAFSNIAKTINNLRLIQ